MREGRGGGSECGWNEEGPHVECYGSAVSVTAQRLADSSKDSLCDEVQYKNPPVSRGRIRDPAGLIRSNVCEYTFLKYFGSVLSFCRRVGSCAFILASESTLIRSAAVYGHVRLNPAADIAHATRCAAHELILPSFAECKPNGQGEGGPTCQTWPSIQPQTVPFPIHPSSCSLGPQRGRTEPGPSLISLHSPASHREAPA